jgi:hypothetical protein
MEREAAVWPESLTELAFVALWLFVGLVSLYDAYLVVLYSSTILDLEQNPICRYLIQRGDGNLTLFLRAKAAGTCTVLATLAALYLRNQRFGQLIALGVAAFQLGLLWYLTLY